LARKERLFSPALRAVMTMKDIFFLLIQVEEAHTPAWPTALPKLGKPHIDLADRCARARDFAASEVPSDRFTVYVDTWENTFATRFHAWPDKYVLLDEGRKVIAKSTYNAYREATLDLDCVDLILSL
jgi:hypothetical protein